MEGPFSEDPNETREDDLEDWRSFCVAYHGPVRDTFQLLLRCSAEEADDAAMDFLIKAQRTGYLEKYKLSKAKLEASGKKSLHRNYLFTSLKHHADDIRRREVRRKETALTEQAVGSLVGPRIDSLDPDAVYALLVLHRALQALRHHCERIGKKHIWDFFYEIHLAPEFRDGRPSKSVDDLLADFPGANRQFVHNSLTTAKRAFQRFVHEAVPRSLRDDHGGAASRFDDWMAILKRSNASQFNLLHIAYRVLPLPVGEDNSTDSEVMVVPEGAVTYETPSTNPTDVDEVSLLFSFRLEMPLAETLDTQALERAVPADNPLLVTPCGGFARMQRAFCLLTLVEPTMEEAKALESVDVPGLLDRLKLLSKQLKNEPEQGSPLVFAQLLYTLSSALALVRYGRVIYSIKSRRLADNLRWFLKQDGFDGRLVPLFQEALSLLENEPEPLGARNRLPEALDF